MRYILCPVTYAGCSAPLGLTWHGSPRLIWHGFLPLGCFLFLQEGGGPSGYVSASSRRMDGTAHIAGRACEKGAGWRVHFVLSRRGSIYGCSDSPGVTPKAGHAFSARQRTFVLQRGIPMAAVGRIELREAKNVRAHVLLKRLIASIKEKKKTKISVVPFHGQRLARRGSLRNAERAVRQFLSEK